MASPVITTRGYLESDYLEDMYGSTQADYAYGSQSTFLKAYLLGFQATLVVYNTTQLRILSTFTSRGAASLGGNNWTTTSQASGDFLPKNLNTDVEEQVFRSAVPSVILTCDTGVNQGVTIDTLAIRNHNLTTSATVVLQGSKNNFANIEVSITIKPERLHTYYIAPTFPIGEINQNRYWRLVIDDPTNPNGYVQIGCILFGNAAIFSKDGSFTQPIKHGYEHFKDELPTEGFTTDNNDRALKRYLSLDFQSLKRNQGDVRLIENYMTAARTSQKCLIIPRPSNPSRYAVFAKLTDMPEFSEVDNTDDTDATAIEESYVDCSLSWKESR
jgi:hypothetical protein